MSDDTASKAFTDQLGDARCPRAFPFFHGGRCWQAHYYDNLTIYGPSAEPTTTESEE